MKTFFPQISQIRYAFTPFSADKKPLSSSPELRRSAKSADYLFLFPHLCDQNHGSIPIINKRHHAFYK